MISAYFILFIDESINIVYSVCKKAGSSKRSEQMRYLPHTGEEIASMLEAVGLMVFHPR